MLSWSFILINDVFVFKWNWLIANKTRCYLFTHKCSHWILHFFITLVYLFVYAFILFYDYKILSSINWRYQLYWHDCLREYRRIILILPCCFINYNLFDFFGKIHFSIGDKFEFISYICPIKKSIFKKILPSLSKYQLFFSI